MIFDPYRSSKTPKPRAEHVALLSKIAIAAGVRLCSDEPLRCNGDDVSTYRVSVVREDNSVNYIWLPARTFKDPELLAGAIRPWRWLPQEREEFERRQAQWRAELEAQKSASIDLCANRESS
ncbi:MAG TPA: hypothetical protein VHO25_07850, partial [Polyangiaceae bacterium]|nr:hypothetical protein [Polyangiaceae bacterium]